MARCSAAPGETYDTLSTVNGDVRVGRGATADEAKTVNGDIVLEDDVQGRQGQHGQRLAATSAKERPIAREASTVNGGVKLAQARARRRRRVDGLG